MRIQDRNFFKLHSTINSTHHKMMKDCCKDKTAKIRFLVSDEVENTFDARIKVVQNKIYVFAEGGSGKYNVYIRIKNSETQWQCYRKNFYQESKCCVVHNLSNSVYEIKVEDKNFDSIKPIVLSAVVFFTKKTK